MSKRGRPKKKFPSIEELPENFRRAMIKMMAKFDLSDLEEAYENAAFLLDSNSKLFEKKANNEAERRYRSRHFTEQNKTIKTVKDESFHYGYARGYYEAREKHRIWYYCVKCGKHIDLLPNSNSHNAVIKLMRENKWGHLDCP
jgi:hypothetical protein